MEVINHFFFQNYTNPSLQCMIKLTTCILIGFFLLFALRNCNIISQKRQLINKLHEYISQTHVNQPVQMWYSLDRESHLLC